jgi:hypothetical protein
VFTSNGDSADVTIIAAESADRYQVRGSLKTARSQNYDARSCHAPHLRADYVASRLLNVAWGVYRRLTLVHVARRTLGHSSNPHPNTKTPPCPGMYRAQAAVLHSQHLPKSPYFRLFGPLPQPKCGRTRRSGVIRALGNTFRNDI